MDSQNSPWPGLGGSHHFPLYSILCAWPRDQHPNVILSWDSQCYNPTLGFTTKARPCNWRSSQSKVYAQSLRVSWQNAIWMWASWRGIEYTIKGKVAASPKSRPWWALWVQVCLWFIITPKVLQLCTNQLVVWFCAGLCEWLSACRSS